MEKVRCPFSKGKCRDCPIFRGRHYRCPFHKDYHKGRTSISKEREIPPVLEPCSSWLIAPDAPDP